MYENELKDWTQESFHENAEFMIVRVRVALDRNVVESDWRFNYLCVSHLQSQSEFYHFWSF